MIDTASAGLETTRVIFAALASDEAYQNYPLSRGADIALGTGFAALFIGSAI